MIVAVGEVLIDMLSKDEVTDLCDAHDFETKVGGSCANFVVFCNKQGVKATLVATIGADGLGKKILQYLQKEGVCTKQIYTAVKHQTSLILVGKSKNTPEFIPYRDADTQIKNIDVDVIKSSTILHTTAFALSRQPAQSVILNTILLEGMDKQISIDWNYALKIWGPDNNAIEVFEKVMSTQPLLKISLDDVSRFWATDCTADSAKKLLNKYNTMVTCLTCGADGVWFKQYNEAWQFAPSLPANVIDVTGAGDAFWSGFIVAWFAGNRLAQCVNNALLIAKKKVEQKI